MSENINENMTEKEAKKAEELKKKELEREKYQEQLNDPNLTKKEKKKIKRKKGKLTFSKNHQWKKLLNTATQVDRVSLMQISFLIITKVTAGWLARIE